MAGTTRSLADAALKEDYLPSIVEQLNNDIPLLSYAEQNTEDVVGRRAVLPVHVLRNQGIGARAESGTLPTAGYQGYAEERIPVFYNYGRLQVTGPLIAAMARDDGSFARAVDSETQGLTSDLKRDVNRQVWGDGTGAIAQCGLSSNSNVISLSSSSTVQVRQLEVNEVVDISTLAGAASPTITTGATISAVDVANKTITLSAVTITTTTGNYVFRTGNGGVVGTSQKEITGAQLIVDSTGTVFNVNPSTYPSWAATEKGNSGTLRQVSENLLSQALHEIQIAGGEWANMGVSSDGVHRAISALLTGLKRFPNTRQMKGGYEGIDFAAAGPVVTITWDRDCPANSLYFFNTKYLKHFKMNDWDWMNEDGAVLSRVASTDAYEAVLFIYHEFATTKRNAHGKVVDLTEA